MFGKSVLQIYYHIHEWSMDPMNFSLINNRLILTDIFVLNRSVLKPLTKSSILWERSWYYWSMFPTLPQGIIEHWYIWNVIPKRPLIISFICLLNYSIIMRQKVPDSGRFYVHVQANSVEAMSGQNKGWRYIGF